MPKHHEAHSPNDGRWNGPPVALLWDQSLVWGLLCLETLQRLRIPFHLLSGRDVAEGRLETYRVLLVPGGWASHKVRALGEAGEGALRHFLGNGGSYLGFCGGAGMALSNPPSLGLVPVERMPLAERLPNASGEIWIQGDKAHPVWRDLPSCIPVSIWWPSQFSPDSLNGCRSLATYHSTGAGFMVADLPVEDFRTLEASGGSVPWGEYETLYGINLHPGRILGQPAIVEATLGQGSLVLCYPHLETPGNEWGNRLLKNVLSYLDEMAAIHRGQDFELHPSSSLCSERGDIFPPSHPVTREEPLATSATEPLPSRLEALRCLDRACSLAEDLIRFGERHLLWAWRTPWLLQWRRGIRGLEYGTLYISLKALEASARLEGSGPNASCPWTAAARHMEEELRTFCDRAKRLLLEEKLANASGHLSKLGSINATVDHLRAELFGSRMNHAGRCRALFDSLDDLLFQALRHRVPENLIAAGPKPPGSRTLPSPRIP